MIAGTGPLMSPNDEKLLDLFTTFRGIPGRCFRALSSDGEGLEQKIKTAINDIASIKDYAMATSGPMPFKTPMSDILVRLEPTDGEWGYPVTELLSKHVARLVFEKISLHQSITMRDSIESLLHSPRTRGWGGNLFKQAVHQQFCAGVTFHCQAMDNDSPTLDIHINQVKCVGDHYFHMISVREQARSRKVAITFSNQYLIPLSSTADTIDSVYISKDVTVLFRITVFPSHDLDLKGITEIIDELPPDAKKRICIVFVVPDHDVIVKQYKRQKIVIPAGTPSSVSTLVEQYHQYVYYFNMNEI
jgi:hypothetical protein